MPNVSEITQTLRDIIESESELNDVWTQGDISNVKRPPGSNCYFTLKEDGAKIECVVFPWASSYHDWISSPDLRLDGTSWLVKGSVELYSKESGYRFVVTDIQPLDDATVQPEFP